MVLDKLVNEDDTQGDGRRHRLVGWEFFFFFVDGVGIHSEVPRGRRERRIRRRSRKIIFFLTSVSR